MNFGTLDIETLGTPEACGTTNIVMPNFALVVHRGEELPYIIYGQLNVSEQLFHNAKVSAGTLVFWLKEAVKGNKAAKEITSILDSNQSGFRVFSSLEKGLWVPCDNNADVFKCVLSRLEFRSYTTLRWYGNGPEFDMNIYSANSFHANQGKAILPWQFWDLKSARNVKHKTSNFKELIEAGEIWAKTIFEVYDIEKHGLSAVKHNPIFDALVESYCIANTEEK